MIPNAEIREIFESTVVKWFQDKAKGTDRRTLFHAVWNGDSELLTREMSTLLRMTIITDPAILEKNSELPLAKIFPS